MNKPIVITALILGALSVILGAFGAHGLKDLLEPETLKTFETGVRYQMYHALFLLFTGSTTMISFKTKRWVFYLIIIGVIFFSGSLYGLATNDLTTFNFKAIGFITPIGGFLFILSWIIVLIDVFKAKNNNILH
jgi:uncharacterized membrane protein YgdD (TMEM256/DUF423 family)